MMDWVGRSRSVQMSRRSLLAGLTASLVAALGDTACAMQRSPGTTYAADFRAFGLNDRQVLQAAFRAWVARGGDLELEADRVYDLGSQSTDDNVFVLFGMRDAVLRGNGATLRIRTAADISYNLLYLAYYRNLRIENLRAMDAGYRDSWVRGAKFIVLDTGDRDSVNITLDNVAGERLLSFVQVQGPPGSARVRGVRIEPNCRATRVFYALNCQNQGDDISGGFTAVNCGRAYFPYGVARHDLAIRVHHDGRAVAASAESCVLIKSYGPPTSGIRLDLSFTGSLPWRGEEDGRERPGSCVALEHQHDPQMGPSVIQDVELAIDIAAGTLDPYGAHRIVFRSYSQDGREESGTTANVWRNIVVAGNLRPGASPAIFSRVRPAIASEVVIAPGTIGADASSVRAPGFRFKIG